VSTQDRLFLPFDGYEIPAVLTCPEHTDMPYPAVLMLHGFLSYKEGDGHLLARLADAFADNGIVSLRIDFCSMGENRCDRMYYGMGQMLKETAFTFHWMQMAGKLDSSRLAILGHSLGAKAAFLSAGLEPKVLIGINGAYGHVALGDEKGCRAQGRTIVYTSDGRHELLYPRFFDELNAYADLSAARVFQGHAILCIGKEDPTVPPEYSRQMAASLPDAEVYEAEGANHTFNAKTADGTKVKELAAWLNSALDRCLK